MGDDRDRLQAAAARQGIGDLRQRVLVPVQQDDRGAGRSGPHDLPIIGQAIVNEQNLAARRRQRGRHGGSGCNGERDGRAGRAAIT